MVAADRSKELSRRLTDLVDKALKEKGLSARAVSIEVVGHDGLIRDIRAGRIPSYDRVRELLEYLDIDLYLRSEPLNGREETLGFAESAAVPIGKSIEGDHDALRHGFLPIPFNRFDPTYRGVAPIAYAKSWLADRRLSPEDLTIVGMPNSDMAPFISQDELLLVDGARSLDDDIALSAFLLDGKLGVGWATEPKPGALAIMFEGRFSTPVALHQKRQIRYRHLGNVVARFGNMAALWLSNVEKMDVRKRIEALMSRC